MQDSDMEHQHKTENKLIKIKSESGSPTDSLQDEKEAPDGGLQAWLVAAGGFSIAFSCLGFTSAFGVLQEYYITHQLRDKSADEIAWIGSIAGFIQFAGGALGGPLFDRYGAWMLRPATLAYVFGMMMVSICTEYWHFILTQGVLMGLAMAFLQFPAFAAVSQYFDKKRAAALGIVISGSSIGGVVIPIALSKMLNSSSIGFGWSIRVIGFTILPFMIFACVTVKPRLAPRPTNFFIPEAFKDKKYDLLVASMFFMMMGMWTPLFFLPTYAVSRGMHATLASYLLAVINAASTFGRIIPGVLADKYGRLNMFCFAGLSTGIIILVLNQAKSTAGLVVYSIAFGFCSGTIISAASAAISMCSTDPRNIGTYMGMGMGIASVAALIGPPVNGALIDKYGGFFEVSIFSGVICLVGGVLAVSCKLVVPQGLLGKA